MHTSTRSPAAQGPRIACVCIWVRSCSSTRLSRSPKGELPQRGEIAGREIVLESALGGLGDVNLSFFQPLNEIVRRDVDNLDVVGAIDDRVGNRLANADLVIWATISLRLSMCWMLTVV